MRASLNFYQSYDWVGFGLGSTHHTWVEPIVYWNPDKKDEVEPKPKALWFWHLSIRLFKREVNACIWSVQQVVARRGKQKK